MKNEQWHEIGSKFAHLTSLHPCYNEKAHFEIGRIHLPVAKKCNIQCNFCNRKIDKCEHRPGVTSSIDTPIEALEKIKKTIKEMKNVKVVGIAGPGEPLYNEETFETLKLVQDNFPDLIRCIASNGLLLPKKVDQLLDLGVNTITVTINAIDPEIGKNIYSHIKHNGNKYKGEEGAKILINNQLEGVKKASENGLIVKINTVLIPEINAGEVEKIAKEAAERGAVLMNIIPLIPLYKFSDMDEPTCEDLESARKIAEQFLPQFRLCRQCRADAVGVPGLEPCGSPAQKRGSEYFHG
ncbi:MAG: radical SAM protein [Halobacteriota archaeon]|nr:radical SAM protein [Halobacteriota archaeon]